VFSGHCLDSFNQSFNCFDLEVMGPQEGGHYRPFIMIRINDQYFFIKLFHFIYPQQNNNAIIVPNIPDPESHGDIYGSDNKQLTGSL
jgi:hypothetical protein